MSIIFLFAAADSPFAWDFLGAWGPALPMFLAMVWFTDRLFRRFVEKGFRELRDATVEHERAQAARHKEIVAMFDEQMKAFEHASANGRK